MSHLLDNRYLVIKTLGSGGFGDTYLAEDTKMPSKRQCVIKQLKPVADNPQMYTLLQQRFQREAAVLEHLGEESRYIPKLYASFTENGLFYLVQEWIEGLTIAESVASQGAWQEPAVRAMMIGVLHTLIYVHDRGIIHRDIKPDNIILRNGEPVLIDFGAVKETLNVSTIPNIAHTARSIVIGTPGFMASEQAAGRPFFASDLYSLAITAIFALTGKYPQQIGTNQTTGELHWQPHLANGQGISADLKAVFAKVLQFDPRDRYSSAKEMLAALQVGTSQAAQIPTIAAIPQLAIPPRKSLALKPLLLTILAGGMIGVAIALGVAAYRNGSLVAFWQGLIPQALQKYPFYFLADSAFEDVNNAKLQVEKLRAQGYSNAGMFWIPDYPNLGDRQYQQVYAEKFADLASCEAKLTAHRRYVADAYCAYASLNAQDRARNQ
jgi:serine/threonine-protein kinase